MFKDKVVVITGAGSGLGAQLSIEFCRNGAIVIGFGRNEEKLKNTNSKIPNNRFKYYSLDVSDHINVSHAVCEVISKFNKIDYLYNNAAVYPKINFLKETAADFLSAITINVCGISNLCKAILPYMLENGFGRIYNVGSWAHLSPINNSAAYSCSKGAVHSLTKAIAKDIENIDVDIQIHEWIPGHLKTAMSEFTGVDPKIAAQWGLKISGLRNIKNRNCIYVGDSEWTPPISLLQKIKSKLFIWKK